MRVVDRTELSAEAFINLSAVCEQMRVLCVYYWLKIRFEVSTAMVELLASRDHTAEVVTNVDDAKALLALDYFDLLCWTSICQVVQVIY